jgi:phage terminase small subunit
MKKSMQTLAAIVAFSSLLLACSTPAEKVTKAENNVIEAEAALELTQEQYLQDMEDFKRVNNERIAANDQTIAEFNARVANQKAEAKEDYRKKVADLEAKNADMKSKIADFKAESQAGWAQFKADFNAEMDALGESFKAMGE